MCLNAMILTNPYFQNTAPLSTDKKKMLIKFIKKNSVLGKIIFNIV